MFDQNDLDDLADAFDLMRQRKGMPYNQADEQLFIDKVQKLVESGLSLPTAKKKAFDFVVESK